MAKKHISSRVDETTKREVEQFAEERDITQSEAVRLLVDRGIDYEQGRIQVPDDEDGEDRDDLKLPSTLRGWSLFVLGFLTAALTSPGVLVVLLAGAVVWSVGGASLAYPLAAAGGGWLAGRAALPALVRRLSRDSADVEAGARAFHRGTD